MAAAGKSPGCGVIARHRLNFALPGVRCEGAEMINQTRELDPVHTGVRRARQPSFPLARFRAVAGDLGAVLYALFAF